jgi:hypothetical protein
MSQDREMRKWVITLWFAGKGRGIFFRFFDPKSKCDSASAKICDPQKVVPLPKACFQEPMRRRS